MRITLKIMVILAATLPAPAFAKAPVNEWFCKVLKAPFDPVVAIATFPLEQLPAAIETREEETDDDGEKRTSVNVKAEGEIYTVEYTYAFKNADVSDPYGFDLSIDAGYSASEDFLVQTEKWLAEFGKPERSSLGRAVYAGPPIYKGGDPVFRFERWSAIGNYSANWWGRGDLRYAAELCK